MDVYDLGSGLIGCEINHLDSSVFIFITFFYGFPESFLNDELNQYGIVNDSDRV